jgi:hypothetical protein
MATKHKAPNLKRETAGRYRTDDSRFVIRQQSGQWWVMDTEQTDELGQQALDSPYPSLSEATEAMSSMPPKAGQPKRQRAATGHR